jgi:hypothetical protein
MSLEGSAIPLSVFTECRSSSAAGNWHTALLLTALLCGTANSVSALPQLERGLVVHLPLKIDLLDHAPKAHPVEVSGQVELRDGGAWFAGGKDWLDLPFVPLNDRPFAIAVWLKPAGSDPTYGVLEQWDRDVPGHILHLMIRNGLSPYLGFYVNDLVSPVVLSNAGTWQHLVFQYDGKYQQIWINGRFICRRAAEPYHGTAGKTLIGKSPGWSNVPSKNYAGWMSDFRIYDRALAFDEIEALAAAKPPAFESVLAPLNVPPPPASPGSVAPPGSSEVPLLSIDGDHLQLRGKPGEEYVVEASEDLINWEELGTLVVGLEGVVDFEDADAAQFRQRFYSIRYRVSK